MAAICSRVNVLNSCLNIGIRRSRAATRSGLVVSAASAASPGWPKTSQKVRHGGRDQQRDVLIERAPDMLSNAGPLAFMQSRQNADDRKHSPHHVVDRSPSTQWPSGRARHVGKPAHHLHHFVEGRPMLVGTGKKPLERAIDEPRIELRQCLVAKTDFVHPTGTEVLDQHVSAGKQLFCECEPARVRKLKGNAALVAVEGDEKTSPRPRQPPCVVPWSGRL